MDIPFHDLGGQAWAVEPLNYLITTHLAIVSRFQESRRYVSLHQANGNAFSYEFASILRDAGSAFGSFSDAVVKGSNPEKWGERDPTIGDFRKFYLKLQPRLNELNIQAAGITSPNRLLAPFWGWTSKKPPDWWKAHNEVKHSEYRNASRGNLKNAMCALAAVEIVLRRATSVFQSELFELVGFNWTPSDASKLLF